MTSTISKTARKAKGYEKRRGISLEEKFFYRNFKMDFQGNLIHKPCGGTNVLINKSGRPYCADDCNATLKEALTNFLKRVES